MLKANNVNVRCLALLFLRTFVEAGQVYACLSGVFGDNKMVNVITVGEYAMRLLDEEQLNHGGFRLPRIPIKLQKEIRQRVEKLQKHREEIIQRERSRSRDRLP